ncbi:MAG: TetR/AcrR family transcriptional regulator [Actinomycetota bacterium]|nr:TetR/AcrR family transcriptional regulator [Actinomycetota bacterium]
MIDDAPDGATPSAGRASDLEQSDRQRPDRQQPDRLPPNRQQLRNERSTRALLDAAAELIVEGGFESLTLAAIGERAGYSRGLVTARFGSKEALVGALIDRIVRRWNHRNVMPRTEGASGRDGVLILVDAIGEQAARDPSSLRVLYALMFEALGPDEALRARFAKFHDGMRSDVAGLVERGHRDGSLDPSVDAALTAQFVVGGLRGIAYQWLLDPDRVDPVPALAHLHRTLATVLVAPEGDE